MIPPPLHGAAKIAADAPALVGPRRTLSYGALDCTVSATAARLHDGGVEPGARIALRLRRDWRYAVLLFGLIRSGAVACPLSTRLPPRGIAARVRRIGCRTLITDDGALRADLDAGIRALSPTALIGDRSSALPPPEPIPPQRPATVVFTSGSTGEPKAALHSFGNHYWSARGSNENIPLEPGDRWLLSLPLYHVGGLAILFRCMVAGATVVVPDRGAPLRETIRRRGVTHASMVSTQLARLLREDGCAADGLKSILLGGSAIPPSLLDEAHARGLPVHTTYGLTEMASQVTTTPPGATAEQLRTSGTLLPYRELAIAADGEILVKGDALFGGYIADDTVRRLVDAGGWFHTGDLGALDADGYLHVRGRKDNMFVSGGENIQPEAIERALCRLEGVAEAVVVPVPDEEYGARPVAFVRVEAGAAALDDLRARLESVLPRFKIPNAFYPFPDDAGTGRVKVDRGALRERALRLRENSRA